MALIKKKGTVKYYCLYCGETMSLSREYVSNNEEIEYFLQCTTKCKSTGPRIGDGGEITRREKCIEEVFTSTKSKDVCGYKILTCGKCAKDCVGFSEDIHKACPYPGCDGVVHEIPEHARMP